MEWQLMDSAPKDKDILLFCPNRGVVRGRWEEDKYAKTPRPYWKNDRERSFGTRETRADQPTHWMPLPKAPNVEFSGGAPLFGATSAGTQG